MRTGRPAAVVTVTAEQQLELETWSRRAKAAQVLALRSRIILLAAQGGSNKSIALKLSTTLHTVGKWRRRFASSGNAGLLDDPRLGTSSTIPTKTPSHSYGIKSQVRYLIPSLDFVRELQTQTLVP
jgi:hypothetical protein